MKNKIQMIYDHLIKTKVVKEEQLEIWESDSKTYTTNSLDGSHDISKRREFQCNITINNLVPGQDRDAIEFSLIWWLNLYEPDHDPNKARFKVEANIIDQRITDLWIGFHLTEKSKHEAGETKLCIKPLLMNADMMDLLPAELKDPITGKKININHE